MLLDDGRYLTIGVGLRGEQEQALVTLLQDFADMFSAKPSDLPDVQRELVEHSVAIAPGARPIKQEILRQPRDREFFILEQVRSVEEEGTIRRVSQPEWVSNPVVIRGLDGQAALRMDFTDLNRACLEDPFKLRQVEQVENFAEGCGALSLLALFSGPRQILLAKEDQENTTFVTTAGHYCHTRIPFGLKNAGASFQRALHACLGGQVGRNALSCGSNIVVTTQARADLVFDLHETLDNLRRSGLKLCPEGCAIGMEPRGLLNSLVSRRAV